MVLESTMICVDDSDFMRNGDFTPTRLAAMQDAVNIVCLSKTRANPENNVGLLTMAGSEVLSTLTTDVNKLVSKLLAVQPQGEIKLLSGLRVAHLALKHRQGKNHKMRIVVFVGSPLAVDKGELVRLAKRLKKEKVNVDIISFGEHEKNREALDSFIDTLNGKDGAGGSHHVCVPANSSLTDALVQSPVLQGEDGAPVAGIGGGFDFGMDADDPELALALRVSMEEQRARQEAEARANNPTAAAPGGSSDDQMLEQALQMSMDNRGPSGSAGVPDFAAMTEEEQIAYAMQMSMQDAASSTSEPIKTEIKAEGEDSTPSDNEMDIDEATQGEQPDPEYLREMLQEMGRKSEEKKKDNNK